jgi:muramoyltetrapeptide carboxypeptidase LdcA involved in peptidoglycan recycling
MKRPRRLKAGDTVAIVAPSSGIAAEFPHVVELGLRNLRDVFGLRIERFPTSHMDNDALYRDPRVRADDINAAFARDDIAAIISTIGGDDSVRILPRLDLDLIAAHPKILMGFSDITTLTTVLNQRGLVTFNGPSVMAGFAQLHNMPSALADHVRAILMEPTDSYEYRPYPAWTNEYVSWTTPGYSGETKPLQPHDGWRWLRGSGRVRGRLWGGCIEVLEFMKGTAFWPAPAFWDERILFFETSEEKPTVDRVVRMLRNYGSIGALDRIAALLIGRARSYTPDEKRELDEALVRVVSVEFRRSDLPIVSNLDFGHTDPQWIMPLGVMAEVDCDARTFVLLEPAVA